MKTEDQLVALETLQKWIGGHADGVTTVVTDTLYVIVKRVGRECASATVDVYVIVTDGDKTRLQWVSGPIARLCGFRQERKGDQLRDGFVVNNDGTPWEFQIAHTLGRILFPEGNEKTTDGGYVLKGERL